MLEGNRMSLLPSATYSAPGAPLYGGGGGGSSTLPSTLTVGPNATSTSQIVIYGDANEKLKIESVGVNSAIYHTNASGTPDTPYIGFGGTSGNLNIRDPSNNVMISFSSIGGGVNLNCGIAMNNNTMNLDIAKNAALYYSAGDSNVYLTGLSTHRVNIGTQSNASLLSVQDNLVTINGKTPVVNWSTIGLNATNFPGGAGTVPISNVPFAMTDSFVVDTTRKYRVSLEAGYANADATGSYTAVYVGGTTPTVYLTTINNSNAIPAQNDARGGCSAIFAPTLSTVQIICANSSGIAATGIQVNTAAGVVVEDLGPA
jgi:hypothetical protein